MINYNNKKFRPVRNSESGESSSHTLFRYKQEGKIIYSNYEGGDIVTGHLLGLVSDNGEIHFSYHQINIAGELRTGSCHSIPELLKDGRIRLYETWTWTNGDKSHGKSVLEEVIR